MGDTRDVNRPKGPAKGAVTSDLAARIRRARGTKKASRISRVLGSEAQNSGLGRAARLGTEFIAAILVGTGLGLGIDMAAGTGPWFMLVFLLVGFAAGILNVVRVAAEMNAANPPPPGADLGPDDDEDDDTA